MPDKPLTKEAVKYYFELFESNLFEFVKYFLSHYLTYKTPQVHVEMYNLLEKTPRLLLASPRGFAKAQSLDSSILTLSGWKKLKNIHPGSIVIGQDGLPSDVIGETPVTKMDLYRVTTRDGRSTLCNLDHLWGVTCPQNNGEKTVIRTTRTLLKSYKKERIDKRTGKFHQEYKYFLDWAKPIEFGEKQLLIDPYTLGAWLGDGTSADGGFTTADPEMLDYFPYKILNPKTRYKYTIKGIRPKLRELNVLNNKHIPNEYLFGSVKQREQLLQGLIDTDGSVVKGGHIVEFCNINKTLIDNTTDLVRSLGGTATIGDGIVRARGKEFHYYKITARFPKEITPVRLKRKYNLWRKSLKTKSAIVNISYEKTGLGKCLNVEDDYYITDDYILTHNSTICAIFYPLWCALFEKRKDICIISASENLATEWLRKIRYEIETNEKIHLFFGDLKSDKWTETHIILNTPSKVNIRAKGAGGQIRGFRPDLLILDDIETDESVKSEEIRSSLRDWIYKACLNTLLPTGQFIMIGTIIDHLSLLNEFLASSNNWTKKRYQAYREGNQKAGFEMWPDLWTHEKLQERKKEIGTWAFATEFMNDPISNENAPIRPTQIREWVDLPDDLNMVIAVDPAYSEDVKADFKVASLIGIRPNNDRYLVSYIRTHKPSGEFINHFLNIYLQYKGRISAVGIPSAGTEKQFYKTVLDMAQQRNLSPPFIELKNAYQSSTIGKTYRRKKDRLVAALQPLFESGRYFIHKSHSEARDELLTIGASRWDDIVDTMAYAEQILQPNYLPPPTPERGRYGEIIQDSDGANNWDYGY